MTEIVYLLTNPSIPDLVKIGQTGDLESRIKSLSSHSGIPVPFELYYACEVENGLDVEKRIHFGFGDHRVNPKREFFRINPERVKMILEGWSIREIAPTSGIVEDEEDRETLKKENARLPAFRFSMVDIKAGSKLTFIKDENISCKVINDKEIEYEGVQSSLSRVTRNVMHEKFESQWATFRGPDFWIFGNETLTERRHRMEESED